MYYQNCDLVSGQRLQSFDEITGAKFETKTATAAGRYKAWRESSYYERSVSVDKVRSGAAFTSPEHSDVPACVKVQLH